MKADIGIYNMHMHAKGGGEKKTLALAEHLSRTQHVWLLVNEPLNLTALERYFGVDLGKVKVVLLSKDRQPAIKKQRRFPGYRWDALTAQLDHFLQIKALKLDIFINNTGGSNLPCPAPRGIYMCMFPHALPIPCRAESVQRRAYHWFMDWAERQVLGCCVTDFINSYSAVTANSRFTSEWVEKMWGRSPEVIYSTCDSMGPAANKERIILNVGRFYACSADTLYKRQDVLLDVFNRLTNIHMDGWQLHFAGSVARDAESLALLARLKEAANDRLVFFHLDADLNVLRNLYRRASIYWHATGYGFPTREYPSHQEHFGMTTVEAMSAGAVPVVINSGGQREIVAQGINGFLWDDLPTLADQTVRLIDDHRLMRRLSQQAILSTARFSRAAFNASVDLIIERLVCERPIWSVKRLRAG